MDNKYEIAIFDMDGTILNTLTDIWNSINHSLDKYGFEHRTIDEVRSFVGNGLYKLAERAVPKGTDEATTKLVFDEMISYYGDHSMDTTCPYDDVIDAIKAIREKGIVTAVVSNKVDFAVKDLVERFFDGLFDYAIGEHDGFRVKPYPDMINEILRLSGKSVETAVYIGDTDVDMQTAYNSNMDCIAVSWGFRSKEFIKEKWMFEGEPVIADKPNELPGFF